MKLNRNFLGGGGGKQKTFCGRSVDILSGTAQSQKCIQSQIWQRGVGETRGNSDVIGTG